MTEQATIEVVEREVPVLAVEVRALRITDDASMNAAGEFLRLRVKAMLKLADEAFDSIIAAAHKTHKVAVERKKAATAPLIDAERIVKLAIGDYVAKQRAAQEAERRRVEAEARAKAEQERMEQAVELEKAGKHEAADALIDAPVVIVEPPRIAKPAAPAGVSVRMVWKFRMRDATKINPAFMTPNEQLIAQTVRSAGAGAVGIVGAGIEVYEEPAVSSRSY